jgi:glutamyl-tRNA synthetase
LTDLYLSILAKKGIDKNKDFVLKVVSLIKERAVFVKDFWELSNFFFEAPLEFEAKAAKKNWKEDTSELMTLFIPVISNIEDFSSENIEKEIKEWITSKEIGFGKIMQPLRLSLVGKLAGPHLFDIIAMIGKQETISRIENAIGKL